MNLLKACCSIPFLRKWIASMAKPANPEPEKLFNLNFRNMVGLGAGFDKNAKYLRELETLGFGFVEIGTVTPRPQKGNPKPRLFRFKRDRALINRMGFNNDGVDRIVSRLKAWRANPTGPMLIGGNIGKNKDTHNLDAWMDYEACFKKLHPYVDFFTVNVSSPNTPGLRELQEKPALRRILQGLQMINNSKAVAKPILIKISPDLNRFMLKEVVELAMEIKLDGVVAANTTTFRSDMKQLAKAEKVSGGLSGRPIRKRSNDIIEQVHDLAGYSLPIIASGGIEFGKDVKEKLDLGASLVEVWTAFIYRGPFIVKKICKEFKEIEHGTPVHE